MRISRIKGRLKNVRLIYVEPGVIDDMSIVVYFHTKHHPWFLEFGLQDCLLNFQGDGDWVRSPEILVREFKRDLL